MQLAVYVHHLNSFSFLQLSNEDSFCSSLCSLLLSFFLLQPYPKFVADLRNRMYVSDLQSMLGIRRVQRDYSNEKLDYLDDQGRAAGLSAQNASAWTLQAIACGDSHTAALTGSGAVWIWGSNEEGQLGLGEEVEEVRTRKRKRKEKRWKDMHALA